MVMSTRDQIKAALADTDGMTESELIDSMVDVSDGHALATLRHMTGTGAVVAIKREAFGDLPAVSLYRMPTSGEHVDAIGAALNAQIEEAIKPTLLVPNSPKPVLSGVEGPKKSRSPKKMIAAGRAHMDEIERIAPRLSLSKTPQGPGSSTASPSALPLDRIEALVPVEQFRAYLYVNALAYLNESGGMLTNQFQEELLSARNYLDRLIATYRASGD